MIRQLLLTAFYLCRLASAQTIESAQSKPTDTVLVDTTVIAIFPFNTELYRSFKEGKPATLTYSDLLNIEKVLNTCIGDTTWNRKRNFKESVKSIPGPRWTKAISS